MQLSEIIKYEDCSKLAALIKDAGLHKFKFSILTEVDDSRMLDKVNEDFFYSIKENKDKTVEHSDQVNVDIDGIKFVYKVKEDD